MALADKKVAIFIENIFEDLEYWYPCLRLQEAGATVTTIGPQAGSYKGKNGVPGTADVGIDEVQADMFDALIIPGGYAPDQMRRTPAMVEFVKSMNSQGKIIAAICHAGWMLASADVVKDRTITSFSSIRDDLVNAGGHWVDQEVAKDNNLITSRTPKDLPAFCRSIIEALEG